MTWFGVQDDAFTYTAGEANFHEARALWFDPNADLPKVDREHTALQKYQVIARKPR